MKEYKNEMESFSWDKLWSRTILASVREIFPSFDELAHIIYKIKINKLLEGINLDNARVLELGCGSGMNSVNLFKDHFIQKATLVDFSEKALVVARKNTKPYNVDLICADIFSLNLDEKFDFVFSIGLIEHFMDERRDKAIKIHRRYAKENGFIMIIVPRKSFTSEIIKLLNKIQGYKEYYFSDKEMGRLLEKNTLEIIRKNKMLLGAISCYLLQYENTTKARSDEV